MSVSFISETTADGGGDYPEDMNAGLDAMMRQRWSRDAVPQMLFLLADAPPHQYPGEDYTYHEAIEDAAAKGVAIYPGCGKRRGQADGVSVPGDGGDDGRQVRVSDGRFRRRRVA